jgi:hypothetical protein
MRATCSENMAFSSADPGEQCPDLKLLQSGWQLVSLFAEYFGKEFYTVSPLFTE